MSKYTTSLNEIASRLNPTGTLNEQIESLRSYLFDFNYSLFDESHKKELEDKIVRHYFTREIGQETVALWKFKFENKVKELLPEMNNLYYSASLKFDPLINFESNEEIERNTSSDGSDTSSTVTSGKGLAKAMDTPTSKIVEEELDNYMSNASATEESSQNEVLNSNSNNQDEKIKRTNKGFSGVSPQQLIIDYRNAIINVDMLFIDNLSDLFMLIW